MKFQNKKKLRLISILITLLFLCSTGLFAQMRDITAHEIVADMRAGWNLGNNFDSLGGDETAWGNPSPTQGLFTELRAMGFKTIRIPVSWGEHVGSAPDYTIDSGWLDKVENVVNWVLDSGMYAIVNMHHDNSWLIPTYDTETEVTAQFVAIWTQIANRFKDYNDYLLFELMNEPRVEYSDEEWTGGTEENRDVINHLNQAGLDAVRATGGNNALRFVVLATHAATSLDVAIRDFVIPENEHRIIVSQHTYFPYEFCFETGGSSTWGTDEDKLACDIEADRIRDFWDARFIPVIVGEWGSVNKDNTSDRVTHAEYYANAVRTRGMLPIWWDNGYPDVNQFGLIDRSAYDWYFPEIAQALISGAGSADDSPLPTTSPFPGYDCTAIPVWDAETIYDTNDTVITYNGKVYSNKWWTMGDNPEDSLTEYDVWTFLGMCSSSLTPTPLPGTTAEPTSVPTTVTTPEPTDEPTEAPTTAPTGTNGDANDDGTVDIIDALLIAQYYVGLDPSGFVAGNADVDCSGTIDIIDALLVAQYYVGLITEFPC